MKAPVDRHTANTLTARANYTTLPPWKLPVYPRSAGVSVLRPGVSEEHRQDNFVQLNWMVEGSGRMWLDGESRAIPPDAVVVTMPFSERWNYTEESRWVFRWITFDGPGAVDFFRAYGYDEFMTGVGNCPEADFLEYERNLRENTVISARDNIAIITHILALAGGVRDSGDRDAIRIDRFMTLARRHIADASVDLNALCDMLELHRATLTRIFGAKMQISPGKYLMQLRIQEALHLLRGTRLPIAEVARRSGFRNCGYFARAIRAATKLSPGEFRKQL